MLYGPVPEVAVHVSCPVPEPQSGPLALRLPWGRGLMVIVAEPVVNPDVRVQVVELSVTETRVYVVVDVTGLAKTLKGVPLTTLLTVLLAVPSL